MEKLGVVPDVIDKVPPATLDICFGKTIKVVCGNELVPSKVKDIPTLKWPSEEGSFYLLVMTDPDAPSRKFPKMGEWHHWLVGNIPGNEVSQGETLSAYIGAGPPKNTGFHRYVLLVYKQPCKLSFNERRLTNRSSRGRALFSIRKFAKKYDLGEPIAGNCFQAQWDSYVPQLCKQLGL